MSELQVPDFQTMKEIKKWAKNLTDKEIQSWTTQDWLKVYEKVDAYVESPDFDAIYKKKLQSLIDKGVIKGKAEDFANPQYLKAYKRKAFIQLEGGNVFAKLNRNYRFEPQHLKRIRELGREAGKQMAQKGVNLVDLAIRRSDEGLVDLMMDANDITIGQTRYSMYKKAYDDFFTVGIDNEMNAGGLATYEENGHRKLLVNNKHGYDTKVHIAFHEAAHLHMQNGTDIQKQLMRGGVVADPEFGEDFYKLMQKNGEYYMSPERAHGTVSSDFFGFLNKDKRKKEKMAFNGYHKQPMEKYSEIYGIEAERALRVESKQSTERTAILIANHICGKEGSPNYTNGLLSYIGKPAAVNHTERGIELTYRTADTNLLEESIMYKFRDMDNNLLQAMDIRTNRYFGEVKLTVPTDYSFAKKYRQYASVAKPGKHVPPVEKVIASKFIHLFGGMPESVYYTDPKKIFLNYRADAAFVKDLFENNRFGKFSKGVLKNIEIESLGYNKCSIAIPKDAGKAYDVLREMRAVYDKVDNYNTSVKVDQYIAQKQASAAAMENINPRYPTTVAMHMEQSTAQASEKAAQKTATKSALRAQASNAARKIGQAATNAVKTTGDMALKANAKFDAAVDKVIDKGAKKLNNSTVGKAYQNAANKVAESKVGKAVAKKTAKVTQRVAASTAGKAVGKVVAKTATTAVGKSVLKKIPLVSAVAGAYFAYDRLKNGDWKGACGEMASGIAGCFPGLGTATSVAIDAGLAAKDIHQVVQDNKKQVAQATPKTPTLQQKKVTPKDLSKQIAQRTETNKKTMQKTTVNKQQIAQTQQNSRA